MDGRAFSWFLGGSLILAACGGDFTPYSEIDRLRVLAVGADRPWLEPTETASISALIVQPPDADVPLSYRWSWCPLTLGNASGYECAFTEAELQEQIDGAVGPGVFQVPPFQLGETSTVTFAYDLSPLLFRGLCDAISMQALPDFVEVPECDGTFPISIRLTVGDGETEVTAIRELVLVYDDAVTDVNTNPLIGAVHADSATVALDGSTLLARDTDVTLSLDIPPEAIEEVDGEPEHVVVTWFVDAGEVDHTRTSETHENVWHTPRTPDHPDSSVRLFFVVRDDRKGVSWIERRVTLKEDETP